MIIITSKILITRFRTVSLTKVISRFVFSNLLSSRPQSALQSPYYRSTPIDPLQEWYPQTMIQTSNRCQSADPSSSGLFSTYPEQQPQSLNSYSLDSHLNTSHYRSTSSITPNLFDYQQKTQTSVSQDNIDKQQNDQTSLTRYVKMLLERSPTHDENKLSNSKFQNIFYLLRMFFFL
jgi:hypothetical protein